MSVVGQKRRFDPLPVTSGLPPGADIIRSTRLVWLVPNSGFEGGLAPIGITVYSSGCERYPATTQLFTKARSI
jgi:hypothetical protein